MRRAKAPMRALKSAPPSAALARPMKTRWAAAPLRLTDLADPDTLDAKIENLLVHHNTLRRGLALPEFDEAELKAKLMEIAPQLTPYMAPVWQLLDRGAPRRSAHFV